MQRFSVVVWDGTISEGKGKITSESGFLSKLPLTYASRVENDKSGTNPEELVASAHAGCFCMMLCNLLNKAGYTPKRLEVRAMIRLDASVGALTESHLQLKANIPEIDTDTLGVLVKEAAETCPISKSLKAETSYEYDLWFT